MADAKVGPPEKDEEPCRRSPEITGELDWPPRPRSPSNNSFVARRLTNGISPLNPKDEALAKVLRDTPEEQANVVLVAASSTKVPHLSPHNQSFKSCIDTTEYEMINDKELPNTCIVPTPTPELLTEEKSSTLIRDVCASEEPKAQDLQDITVSLDHAPYQDSSQLFPDEDSSKYKDNTTEVGGAKELETISKPLDSESTKYSTELMENDNIIAETVKSEVKNEKDEPNHTNTSLPYQDSSQLLSVKDSSESTKDDAAEFSDIQEVQSTSSSDTKPTKVSPELLANVNSNQSTTNNGISEKPNLTDTLENSSQLLSDGDSFKSTKGNTAQMSDVQEVQSIPKSLHSKSTKTSTELLANAYSTQSTIDSDSSEVDSGKEGQSLSDILESVSFEDSTQLLSAKDSSKSTKENSSKMSNDQEVRNASDSSDPEPTQDPTKLLTDDHSTKSIAEKIKTEAENTKKGSNHSVTSQNSSQLSSYHYSPESLEDISEVGEEQKVQNISRSSDPEPHLTQLVTVGNSIKSVTDTMKSEVDKDKEESNHSVIVDPNPSQDSSQLSSNQDSLNSEEDSISEVKKDEKVENSYRSSDPEPIQESTKLLTDHHSTLFIAEKNKYEEENSKEGSKHSVNCRDSSQLSSNQDSLNSEDDNLSEVSKDQEVQNISYSSDPDPTPASTKLLTDDHSTKSIAEESKSEEENTKDGSKPSVSSLGASQLSSNQNSLNSEDDNLSEVSKDQEVQNSSHSPDPDPTPASTKLLTDDHSTKSIAEESKSEEENTKDGSKPSVSSLGASQLSSNQNSLNSEDDNLSEVSKDQEVQNSSHSPDPDPTAASTKLLTDDHSTKSIAEESKSEEESTKDGSKPSVSSLGASQLSSNQNSLNSEDDNLSEVSKDQEVQNSSHSPDPDPTAASTKLLTDDHSTKSIAEESKSEEENTKDGSKPSVSSLGASQLSSNQNSLNSEDDNLSEVSKDQEVQNSSHSPDPDPTPASTKLLTGDYTTEFKAIKSESDAENAKVGSNHSVPLDPASSQDSSQLSSNQDSSKSEDDNVSEVGKDQEVRNISYSSRHDTTQDSTKLLTVDNSTNSLADKIKSEVGMAKEGANLTDSLQDVPDQNSSLLTTDDDSSTHKDNNSEVITGRQVQNISYSSDPEAKQDSPKLLTDRHSTPFLAENMKSEMANAKEESYHSVTFKHTSQVTSQLSSMQDSLTSAEYSTTSEVSNDQEVKNISRCSDPDPTQDSTKLFSDNCSTKPMPEKAHHELGNDEKITNLYLTLDTVPSQDSSHLSINQDLHVSAENNTSDTSDQEVQNISETSYLESSQLLDRPLLPSETTSFKSMTENVIAESVTSTQEEPILPVSSNTLHYQDATQISKNEESSSSMTEDFESGISHPQQVDDDPETTKPETPLRLQDSPLSKNAVLSDSLRSNVSSEMDKSEQITNGPIVPPVDRIQEEKSCQDAISVSSALLKTERTQRSTVSESPINEAASENLKCTECKTQDSEEPDKGIASHVSLTEDGYLINRIPLSPTPSCGESTSKIRNESISIPSLDYLAPDNSQGPQSALSLPPFNCTMKERLSSESSLESLKATTAALRAASPFPSAESVSLAPALPWPKHISASELATKTLRTRRTEHEESSDSLTNALSSLLNDIFQDICKEVFDKTASEISESDPDKIEQISQLFPCTSTDRVESSSQAVDRIKGMSYTLVSHKPNIQTSDFLEDGKKTLLASHLKVSLSPSNDISKNPESNVEREADAQDISHFDTKEAVTEVSAAKICCHDGSPPMISTLNAPSELETSNSEEINLLNRTQPMVRSREFERTVSSKEVAYMGKSSPRETFSPSEENMSKNTENTKVYDESKFSSYVLLAQNSISLPSIGSTTFSRPSSSVPSVEVCVPVNEAPFSNLVGETSKSQTSNLCLSTQWSNTSKSKLLVAAPNTPSDSAQTFPTIAQNPLVAHIDDQPQSSNDSKASVYVNEALEGKNLIQIDSFTAFKDEKKDILTAVLVHESSEQDKEMESSKTPPQSSSPPSPLEELQTILRSGSVTVTVIDRRSSPASGFAPLEQSPQNPVASSSDHWQSLSVSEAGSVSQEETSIDLTQHQQKSISALKPQLQSFGCQEGSDSEKVQSPTSEIPYESMSRSKTVSATGHRTDNVFPLHSESLKTSDLNQILRMSYNEISNSKSGSINTMVHDSYTMENPTNSLVNEDVSVMKSIDRNEAATLSIPAPTNTHEEHSPGEIVDALGNITTDDEKEKEFPTLVGAVVNDEMPSPYDASSKAEMMATSSGSKKRLIPKLVDRFTYSFSSVKQANKTPLHYIALTNTSKAPSKAKIADPDTAVEKTLQSVTKSSSKEQGICGPHHIQLTEYAQEHMSAEYQRQDNLRNAKLTSSQIVAETKSADFAADMKDETCPKHTPISKKELLERNLECGKTDLAKGTSRDALNDATSLHQPSRPHSLESDRFISVDEYVTLDENEDAVYTTKNQWSIDRQSSHTMRRDSKTDGIPLSSTKTTSNNLKEMNINDEKVPNEEIVCVSESTLQQSLAQTDSQLQQATISLSHEQQSIVKTESPHPSDINMEYSRSRKEIVNEEKPCEWEPPKLNPGNLSHRSLLGESETTPDGKSSSLETCVRDSSPLSGSSKCSLPSPPPREVLLRLAEEKCWQAPTLKCAPNISSTSSLKTSWSQLSLEGSTGSAVRRVDTASSPVWSSRLTMRRHVLTPPAIDEVSSKAVMTSPRLDRAAAAAAAAAEAAEARWAAARAAAARAGAGTSRETQTQSTPSSAALAITRNSSEHAGHTHRGGGGGGGGGGGRRVASGRGPQQWRMRRRRRKRRQEALAKEVAAVLQRQLGSLRSSSALDPAALPAAQAAAPPTQTQQPRPAPLDGLGPADLQALRELCNWCFLSIIKENKDKGNIYNKENKEPFDEDPYDSDASYRTEDEEVDVNENDSERSAVRSDAAEFVSTFEKLGEKLDKLEESLEDNDDDYLDLSGSTHSEVGNAEKYDTGIRAKSDTQLPKVAKGAASGPSLQKPNLGFDDDLEEPDGSGRKAVAKAGPVVEPPKDNVCCTSMQRLSLPKPGQSSDKERKDFVCVVCTNEEKDIRISRIEAIIDQKKLVKAKPPLPKSSRPDAQLKDKARRKANVEISQLLSNVNACMNNRADVRTPRLDRWHVLDKPNTALTCPLAKTLLAEEPKEVKRCKKKNARPPKKRKASTADPALNKQRCPKNASRRPTKGSTEFNLLYQHLADALSTTRRWSCPSSDRKATTPGLSRRVLQDVLSPRKKAAKASAGHKTTTPHKPPSKSLGRKPVGDRRTPRTSDGSRSTDRRSSGHRQLCAEHRTNQLLRNQPSWSTGSKSRCAEKPERRTRRKSKRKSSACHSTQPEITKSSSCSSLSSDNTFCSEFSHKDFRLKGRDPNDSSPSPSRRCQLAIQQVLDKEFLASIGRKSRNDCLQRTIGKSPFDLDPWKRDGHGRHKGRR